tara:strand:+ start:1032 stop:1607 length:576 start_codon:yes stop_codon:yes gene_type:complete
MSLIGYAQAGPPIPSVSSPLDLNAKAGPSGPSISVAELMLASNNFASSDVRALLLATNPNQLMHPDRKRPAHGISADERAKMESEMQSPQRDIKSVEDHYGTNMLRLVFANGYRNKPIYFLLDHANQRKPINIPSVPGAGLIRSSVISPTRTWWVGPWTGRRGNALSGAQFSMNSYVYDPFSISDCGFRHY